MLASVLVPHASGLLERLLGDLDADLLVLEQLPEGVTELGGVVKQARPRVRLAREAFENPLRDPRRLCRRWPSPWSPPVAAWPFRIVKVSGSR